MADDQPGPELGQPPNAGNPPGTSQPPAADGLTATDDRLTLARTALEVALAQQTASRTNVRNLAMTVLGAAAVAAAFGAKSISDPALHPNPVTITAAVLGLAAFAAMSLSTARIIWSHDSWTFGTSGTLVSQWQAAGLSMDDINKRVIASHIDRRLKNEESIAEQSKQFKRCVVLLLVVVLASLVVIGSAKL